MLLVKEMEQPAVLWIQFPQLNFKQFIGMDNDELVTGLKNSIKIIHICTTVFKNGSETNISQNKAK